MNNTRWCRLLRGLAFAAGIACLSAQPVLAQGGDAAALTWTEIGGRDVEGRGWSDTEMPFDRVPKRFAKALPRVWQHGVSSTGEFFEFESDTTTVAVRTELAVNYKGWLYPSVAREDEEKTRLFAELSQKVATRHPNFRYMPGGDFYGSDEVSMDGVHPNDEAFANMAVVLAPVISKLVEEYGAFANPVLPADFSDIDCIRSGNRFYAITSTLHLSPGMDILESSDMVNWRVIGHVVDDTSVFGDDWTWKRMRRYGRGVWAGCIRERGGKFYCYFGTPDEGIFVATAENAAGPWSAPHKMSFFTAGWDDTGVLFDDDGKGYLVATHFAGGYKTYVFELTADGLDVVPESRALVNEGHGREANKLYKWNGTYYHLYSEVAGGGRRLMMARSKNVMGPYEERRVLSHPQREADEPNQGGFLVDDAGNWFFFTHHGHGQWYGRAASLLPVTWIDGWPIVGRPDKDGVGTMVWNPPKPVITGKAAILAAVPKGFLSPDWAWNHAPRAEKVRRSESCLELDAFRPLRAGDFFTVGNVFSKRSWRNATNEFSVCLSTAKMSDGQRAGICHFGKTSCEFGVKMEGGVKSLYWRSGRNEVAIGSVTCGKMRLRTMWGKDGVARFAWSYDGKEWKDVGESYRMTWGSYRGDRTGLFTYNESGDAGTAVFTD